GAVTFYLLWLRRAPVVPLFPYTTLFRSLDYGGVQLFPDGGGVERVHTLVRVLDKKGVSRFGEAQIPGDAQVLHLRTLKADGRILDRKSTRLNSSHSQISYAVFCLKKKNN